MRLKFIYKIWSGYDGFTPSSIPKRSDNQGRVPLVWKRYLDSIEIGSEIWVYFYGNRISSPGVYLQGLADKIDYKKKIVWLRPKALRIDRPLTKKKLSKQLTSLVSPRGRQIFLLPEKWAPLQLDIECDIYAHGKSCMERCCQYCREWQSFPLIDLSNCRMPHRLRLANNFIQDYVPAYWIIPSRCYMGRTVNPKLQQLSRLFYELKTGAHSRVHPFALGMYSALKERNLVGCIDLVTSIPLSPDKEANREINRTKLLGKELAFLLGIKYRQILKLDKPISKRRPPWNNFSPASYEREYMKLLSFKNKISGSKVIALVDDVCTRGATMSAAVKFLKAHLPNTKLLVVSAGQMILKSVVVDDLALRI